MGVNHVWQDIMHIISGFMELSAPANTYTAESSVLLQEDAYGGAEAHANGEDICSCCCVVFLACGSSICITCRSHEHQVDCM